jgi:hypothetical protein
MLNHSLIKKLEEELRLAMLESNVEILDKLIADTLVFTLPNGDTANKQMDLHAHNSGFQKLNKLSQYDQQIQLYDNFAVVTVKVELNGKYGDDSISGNYCYTRIWSKLNDRWQVVAGHVSLIPK